MPFGFDKEYPDFAACVAANVGKDSPEAYCGWLKRETENKSTLQLTAVVTKLKLEEITPTRLRVVDQGEISEAHLRTHQWFTQARRLDLSVEAIKHAHDWLADEMSRRDMEHNSPMPVSFPTPATKAADQVVIVSEYVSLVGSAVHNGNLAEAGDLDFVIRDDEDSPRYWHENIWLLLRKIFDPEKTGKAPHLIFNPQGPHDGKYIPLFDLVLRVTEQEPRLIKSAPAMPGWREWMKLAGLPEGTKVDLGPGELRANGFLGVGQGEQAQVQCDLDQTPWPIPDNSASIIRANHCLEHLESQVSSMLEIYRALKPGGIALITVPSTDGLGAFAHPEHKSFWNRASFAFWTSPALAATVDAQTDPPSVFIPIRITERQRGEAVYVDAVLMKPEESIEFIPGGPNGKKSIDKASPHSRASCMERGCPEAPTTEFLWAEGMAHCWLCDEHAEAFRKREVWHGISQVNDEHKLPDGVASANWRDGTPSKTVAEEYKATHKLTKRALTPIANFQAPHPSQRGRGNTDAFQAAEAWEWARARVATGVTVEPKFNGFRSIIQGDGKRVSVRFEGGDEEYDKLVKVDERIAMLTRLPSFILDVDIGVIQSGELWSRPRLQTLAGANPELPAGAHINITAFDILYWNGESVNERPQAERRKFLEEIAPTLKRHGVNITKSHTVKTQKEIEEALTSKSFGSASMMEGLVLKDSTWVYEPGPSTNGMFKIKHTLEVKALVLEVKIAANQKRAYRGGLPPGTLSDDIKNQQEHEGKPYVDMGFSFNSDLRAKVGDTVTFSVDEVIYDEKGQHLAWLGAVPLDVDPTRGPYAAQQMIDLAERAGVLQHTPAEQARKFNVRGWMNQYHDLWIDDHNRLIDMGVAHSDRIPSYGELVRAIEKAQLTLPGMPEGTLTIEFPKPIQIWWPDKHPKHPWLHPLPKSGDWHDLGVAAIAASSEELDKQRKRVPDVEEVGPRGQSALQYWEKAWIDALPPTGTGKFVYQHHWVGLDEEQAEEFSEERLFTDTEHAAHGDLRLEGDEFLWGWSVFIGKMDDNAKLPHKDKLIDFGRLGEKTLQVQPKLAQPKDWLKVGVGEDYVGEPGSAGSRENTWSKFIAQDTGTYRLGYARQHGQEVFFSGGKLKGRYIFQLAPLGGRNIWILGKPEDQEPYATKNKILPILKDVRSKRQSGLVWGDGKRDPIFIRAEDFDGAIEALEEADPEIGEEWDIIEPFNKPPKVTKQLVSEISFVKAADSSGVMICLPVPDSIAQNLAIEDGELPKQMHITLAYFGHASEVDEADMHKIMEKTQAAAALTKKPIRIKVSGAARFSGDGEDPFVALVDSEDIHQFRDRLVSLLGDAGVYRATDHAFTPHITLAYLTKQEPLPDARLTGEFTVNQVQVVTGDERIDIPLGITLELGAFTKASEEKRYTFSVVYKATNDTEHPVDDAHQEFVTADELQEALWDHVRRGDRSIFIQHGLIPSIGFKKAGEWVEITTWPYEVDADFHYADGHAEKRKIPAGSAWMGTIWEEWAWKLVKEGKIRGFSFGGTAQRLTV